MNFLKGAKEAALEKAAAAKEKYDNLDVEKEKARLKEQAYNLKQVAKHATPRRFICETLGYPLEKHVYYTEDGYINTVFRIPGPKGYPEGAPNQGKPVVLYQHGLFDCFAGVICDEKDSLGLRLVNCGYDLWMNNSRGNRYSRDHQFIEVDTSKNEFREKYWGFSFDQMAKYDQPAVWNYILKFT
mgnify:CR=1 FL=1